MLLMSFSTPELLHPSPPPALPLDQHPWRTVSDLQHYPIPRKPDQLPSWRRKTIAPQGGEASLLLLTESQAPSYRGTGECKSLIDVTETNGPRKQNVTHCPLTGTNKQSRGRRSWRSFSVQVMRPATALDPSVHAIPQIGTHIYTHDHVHPGYAHVCTKSHTTNTHTCTQSGKCQL